MRNPKQPCGEAHIEKSPGPQPTTPTSLQSGGSTNSQAYEWSNFGPTSPLILHLILHEARELSGQKLCLLLATKSWGSVLHGISKTKVNPKSGVGPFFRICNLSVITQKWSSNQSVFIYKTWVLSTTPSKSWDQWIQKNFANSRVFKYICWYGYQEQQMSKVAIVFLSFFPLIFTFASCFLLFLHVLNKISQIPKAPSSFRWWSKTLLTSGGIHLLPQAWVLGSRHNHRALQSYSISNLDFPICSTEIIAYLKGFLRRLSEKKYRKTLPITE